MLKCECEVEMTAKELEKKFNEMSKEYLSRKNKGQEIPLEQIRKLANLFGFSSWYSDDEKELIIKRCVFCGGYDYSEEPTPITYNSKFGKLIKNDKRIIVVDCCDCNGCGDW